MSRYCKAYPLGRLRAFAAWSERDPSRALADDHVVYVHDDYTVVDGIFSDDPVVFDDVTEAWKSFCAAALQFEIPGDLAPDTDRAGR